MECERLREMSVNMEKLVIDNEIFFAGVTQALAEGKKVTIPLKGYSMLPFLRGGRDLVELERPEGELRAGDIALYRWRGRWVLHRVMSVDGERMLASGDGNLRGVEDVRREAVAGKVMAVLRDGKVRVDPCSDRELRRFRLWRSLRRARRLLLAVWKGLPWNLWILREQRTEAHAGPRLRD